jgi:AraC family transcriptional regulator of adaptative response/methylated-DNA-[protein]-cysteine methyltransferase
MSASDYHRIERAIDYIVRHQSEQPPLASIANAAGMSPAHFSRVFKRWSGLSPKQFLEVTTLNKAKHRLSDSASLMEAAHVVGLSGSSRLHDLFVSIDGVTPGQFTARSSPPTICYGWVDSPFGRCVIATTERGVCYLSFDDQPAATRLQAIERAWPASKFEHDQQGIERLARQIFATGTKLRTRLHLRGTNFQVKVWMALLEIPQASTVSYGELGKRLGQSGAARAIGQAVGRNQIAWLIPCHRVVLASGALGGYRWGKSRKRTILAWEEARFGTRSQS